jgi:hypothetical protein
MSAVLEHSPDACIATTIKGIVIKSIFTSLKEIKEDDFVMLWTPGGIRVVTKDGAGEHQDSASGIQSRSQAGISIVLHKEFFNPGTYHCKKVFPINLLMRELNGVLKNYNKKDTFTFCIYPPYKQLHIVYENEEQGKHHADFIHASLAQDYKAAANTLPQLPLTYRIAMPLSRFKDVCRKFRQRCMKITVTEGSVVFDGANEHRSGPRVEFKCRTRDAAAGSQEKVIIEYLTEERPIIVSFYQAPYLKYFSKLLVSDTITMGIVQNTRSVMQPLYLNYEHPGFYQVQFMLRAYDDPGSAQQNRTGRTVQDASQLGASHPPPSFLSYVQPLPTTTSKSVTPPPEPVPQEEEEFDNSEEEEDSEAENKKNFFF